MLRHVEEVHGGCDALRTDIRRGIIRDVIVFCVPNGWYCRERSVFSKLVICTCHRYLRSYLRFLLTLAFFFPFFPSHKIEATTILGGSFMATYVLVHGGNMTTDTWNRLTTGNHVQTTDGRMGGKIWDTVIPALKAQNYSVFAPTLGDEYTCNLADHIEQICSLVGEHDLKGITLVGHSYGGMVITGTAARIPERISQLVYVDAALPDSGQSLFDIIVAGGRDPLSFPGLEAVPPYVQELQFDMKVLERFPKTYVFCTQSEFAVVTGAAKKKIVAAAEGWTYLELPTSHVPMASMPEELAEILVGVN
jgi:pimeloyl-ACP methyl ester carboxylesterase